MALTIGQQQAAARIARRQQNAAGVAAASSGGSSGGGSAPARPVLTPAPAPTPAPSGGEESGSTVIGAGPNAGMTVDEAARMAEENGPATFKSTLDIPTRNPGESDADFTARIRSTPFYFAGYNTGGGSSALAAESLSTPSVNRPVLNGNSQNNLSGGNTTGSGAEGIEDYKTQEEKDAKAFLEGQAKIKPKTEQEIIDERTNQAKGLISSLDNLYESKLKDQEQINKQRSAETNAQSVLRGLAGSTEAGARAIDASDKNARANAAIYAEKQAKLSEIYTNIQKDAREEFRYQNEKATTNAKDTIARAEAARAKAVENVKILAGAGFDLDAIMREDPETYKSIVRSVGSEKQVKAMFIVNRPKNDIVGTPIRVGNHYVQMYKNPITGAVTAENIELPQGLPENYSKFEKIKDAAGNEVLVAIPDNWDGDPSKLKKVGGGGAGSTGLTPSTYVKGANPVVDAWAERIYNGQAKITDIPAADKAMRNAVTVALQASGNDLSGRPTVTEMGLAAKATAQNLLDKFNKGSGTSAVGKSGLLGSFGAALIPGTDRADFVNTFNSLKSQLALEGVKYLKGQGQVSDAERALLSQAVTKLSLSQSESEFKTTLQDIINKLNGTSEGSASLESQRQQLRDAGYTEEQIREIESK